MPFINLVSYIPTLKTSIEQANSTHEKSSTQKLPTLKLTKNLSANLPNFEPAKFSRCTVCRHLALGCMLEEGKCAACGCSIVMHQYVSLLPVHTSVWIVRGCCCGNLDWEFYTCFFHASTTSIKVPPPLLAAPHLLPSPSPPLPMPTGLHPRPLVVAGPSGAGKSTLLNRAFKEYPDKFGFSVSRKAVGGNVVPPSVPVRTSSLALLTLHPTLCVDTTRKPRPGEVDGRGISLHIPCIP